MNHSQIPMINKINEDAAIEDDIKVKINYFDSLKFEVEDDKFSEDSEKSPEKKIQEKKMHKKKFFNSSSSSSEDSSEERVNYINKQKFGGI